MVSVLNGAEIVPLKYAAIKVGRVAAVFHDKLCEFLTAFCVSVIFAMHAFCFARTLNQPNDFDETFSRIRFVSVRVRSENCSGRR